MCELGLLYNQCGQHDKAIVQLQRARSLDVLNVYGMDSLAALLYRVGHAQIGKFTKKTYLQIERN